MAGAAHSGYKDLSKQASLIIAVATFAWCTMLDVQLLDAIFRAVIVYLALSIASIWVAGLLDRMSTEALERIDEEQRDEKEDDEVAQSVLTDGSEQANGRTA